MVVRIPGIGLAGGVSGVVISVVVTVITVAVVGISVSGVVVTGFVGFCTSKICPCEADFASGLVHSWYFGGCLFRL